MNFIILSAVELSESWGFLGGAWWVLHIVAIALIFYCGYVVGQASASPADELEDEESFNEEKPPESEISTGVE